MGVYSDINKVSLRYFREEHFDPVVDAFAFSAVNEIGVMRLSINIINELYQIRIKPSATGKCLILLTFQMGPPKIYNRFLLGVNILCLSKSSLTDLCTWLGSRSP